MPVMGTRLFNTAKEGYSYIMGNLEYSEYDGQLLQTQVPGINCLRTAN